MTDATWDGIVSGDRDTVSGTGPRGAGDKLESECTANGKSDIPVTLEAFSVWTLNFRPLLIANRVMYPLITHNKVRK